MNVAQEKEIGIFVVRGNLRLKFFKYIQLGEVRFGFVQTVHVMTTPAKSLALGMFDSSGVHASPSQYPLMLGGEVFADHGHNPHLGEIAGGERKIRGGATQDVLHSSGWRSDVIKGYGTNG